MKKRSKCECECHSISMTNTHCIECALSKYTPIGDIIGQLEKDPEFKALLDNARMRIKNV